MAVMTMAKALSSGYLPIGGLMVGGRVARRTAINVVHIDASVDLRKVMGQLRQNDVARIQVRNVLMHLLNAETGQRGYLLTGDSLYLAPYRQGASRFATDLSRLREMTADNPRQQARLREIETLADDLLVGWRDGEEWAARRTMRRAATWMVVGLVLLKLLLVVGTNAVTPYELHRDELASLVTPTLPPGSSTTSSRPSLRTWSVSRW